MMTFQVILSILLKLLTKSLIYKQEKINKQSMLGDKIHDLKCFIIKKILSES